MIKFNSSAFDVLKGLLGFKTDGELILFLSSINIHISRQNFSGWKKDGTVKLGTLILLCNMTHFPIAYFFIVDDMEHEHDYRIVAPEEWKEIYFVPQNLVRLLHHDTTYRERVSEIGMGRRYSAFRNNDVEALKAMTVKQLLNIINKTSVYLGDALFDENVAIPLRKGVEPSQSITAIRLYRQAFADKVAMEVSYEALEQWNHRIEFENSQLQSSINNLRDVITRQNEMLVQKNIQIAEINANAVGLVKQIAAQQETIKKMNRQKSKHDNYIKNKSKHQ